MPESDTPEPRPDYQRFLAIEGLEVVLDTNVLIQGTDGKAELQRQWIAQFCSLNDARICDTVFYEFLRNCNIDTFRKRRAKMEEWPSREPVKFLREDAKVRRTYERLWVLCLDAMKDEPLRLVHQNREDLWVAAAAVEYRIDRILTTDHQPSDFPAELFTDDRYDLGNNLVLHLKTFRRQAARERWLELLGTPSIPVAFRSFA